MRTQDKQTSKGKIRIEYWRIAIVIIILTIGTVFPIYYLYYFFIFPGGPMKKHEKYFERSLIAAIKSEKGFVYLKNLTDFEWERICVIPPYADKEDIDKVLGFEYDDYKKLFWINDEGFITFLFIKDGKVIPLRLVRKPLEVDYHVDYDTHNARCTNINKAKLIFYDTKINKKVFKLSED